MMQAFLRHTKCDPECVEGIVCSPGTTKKSFFTLAGLRLYGRVNTDSAILAGGNEVSQIESPCSRHHGTSTLPFDPTEIITDLRLEKYVDAVNPGNGHLVSNESFARKVYYALRPLFPVRFRRILQRMALQNWSTIDFPSWPLDTTVDDFIAYLWSVVLQESQRKEIPFIWYWPKGSVSCAIMTHDVETAAGQEFCFDILAMEREYGIRSSFELVPEVRYKVSNSLISAIHNAGSEVCVHGLNHDGKLFSSEKIFRSRVNDIRRYATQWASKGFRSPVMYRNVDWLEDLGFSYDMSLPNTAHLDPQSGGCCTVLPFFIGQMIELPLTTIQDYPLYHILRSDPMAMWSQQISEIAAKNGLASFIIHPDYTRERKRQAGYRDLLALLRKYANDKRMWLALPGEVDAWWRERDAMTLTRDRGRWSISGRGAERAAVAYAQVEHGKVTYRLADEFVAGSDRDYSGRAVAGIC